MKGLHTREKEEDLFGKGEPPADNKVLAKYEYEGKPDVQDNTNVPPQEELPADNETVTADIAKVLAYMDEAYKKKDAVPKTITHYDPLNYNIPSQMRTKNMPTADLGQDEQGAVANHEKTNGVVDMKETQRPAMTANACGGPPGHN